MTPHLLTVAEVADRLRVSPSSVNSYIHLRRDPLPAARIEGLLRVEEPELEAWIERRRTCPRRSA